MNILAIYYSSTIICHSSLLTRHSSALANDKGPGTNDNLSLPFKLRRAFLRISLESFVSIFAFEELLEKLSFEGQRFGLRDLEPGLHGSLYQPHCFARFGRRNELSGVFQYFLE